MMSTLVVLLSGGFLVWVSVPSLARAGRRREMAVVLGVIITGTLYALTLTMDLPLPSLGEMLVWLVRAVTFALP
jgi:hypothetical protein